MTTRRNFLKSGGLSLAGLLVGQKSFAHLTESATSGASLASNTLQYTCQRPAPEKRAVYIHCCRKGYPNYQSTAERSETSLDVRKLLSQYTRYDLRT